MNYYNFYQIRNIIDREKQTDLRLYGIAKDLNSLEPIETIAIETVFNYRKDFLTDEEQLKTFLENYTKCTYTYLEGYYAGMLHIDKNLITSQYRAITIENITTEIDNMPDDKIIEASNSLGVLIPIYKMDEISKVQSEEPMIKDAVAYSKKNCLFKESDKYFWNIDRITPEGEPYKEIYSFSKLNDMTSPIARTNEINTMHETRIRIPWTTANIAYWALTTNNDMGNRVIRTYIDEKNELINTINTNNKAKQNAKEKDTEPEL